ncbi:MAG: hypothetical protein AAGJ46_19295 [Planctomycetota bacterium]
MPNADQHTKRLKKLVTNKSIKAEWIRLKEAGVVRHEWSKVNSEVDALVQFFALALSDKAAERKEAQKLVATYAKPGITKVVDFAEGVRLYAKKLAGVDELTAEAEASAAAKGGVDPRHAAIANELKGLKPQLNAALKASPESKQELLAAVAKVQAALGKAEFEQAEQSLQALRAKTEAIAPSGGGGEASDAGWEAAKQAWASHRESQRSVIGKAMNQLGKLALDAELPEAEVGELIDELSAFVPEFDKSADGIDSAIQSVDAAADSAARKTAAAGLETAKQQMADFCSGPRLTEILEAFEDQDFFTPTLAAVGELRPA